MNIYFAKPRPTFGTHNHTTSTKSNTAGAKKRSCAHHVGKWRIKCSDSITQINA